MNRRPVLGITMGDPAGIGPELCLRALREPSALKICTPVVFGDADLLARVAKSLRRRGRNGKASKPMAAFRILRESEWSSLERVEGPLVVDCQAMDAAKVRPGTISAACGRAAYRYIERAIGAAMDRKLAAVVTAPIHKESLRLAGVPHPGHTEIFTSLTGASHSCMMLYSEALTVSMVTTHIGYGEVPGKLSAARVRDVIKLTADAMFRLLGRRPRLAVCGLNPHAGEHGLFGRLEEECFIHPAITLAGKSGITVEGPLPPDTAFTPTQRKKYDAIVTLYHDQGHIPFKMLAFDTGVNLTLGLPIIRASVDHGTAFDIAWRGLADPRSLFAALGVASGLAADGKGNSL